MAKEGIGGREKELWWWSEFHGQREGDEVKGERKRSSGGSGPIREGRGRRSKEREERGWIGVLWGSSDRFEVVATEGKEPRRRGDEGRSEGENREGERSEGGRCVWEQAAPVGSEGAAARELGFQRREKKGVKRKRYGDVWSLGVGGEDLQRQKGKGCEEEKGRQKKRRSGGGVEGVGEIWRSREGERVGVTDRGRGGCSHGGAAKKKGIGWWDGVCSAEKGEGYGEKKRRDRGRGEVLRCRREKGVAEEELREGRGSCGGERRPRRERLQRREKGSGLLKKKGKGKKEKKRKEREREKEKEKRKGERK